MRFEHAVVCFIDVLGFAAMIQKDAVNPSGPSYLPRLRELIDTLVQGVIGEGVDVRQFSDSIIVTVSYSVENTLDLMERVRVAQLHAICNGIPLRGGISLGKHYSDERIVYSQGLVHAYTLESQKARVPRVLVDKNLVELMIGTAATETSIDMRLSSLLRIDRDGQFFLDYLSKDSLSVHEVGLTRLIASSDVTNERVLDKLEWLVNYHNHLMKIYGYSECSFALPSFRPWGL